MLVFLLLLLLLGTICILLPFLVLVFLLLLLLRLDTLIYSVATRTVGNHVVKSNVVGNHVVKNKRCFATAHDDHSPVLLHTSHNTANTHTKHTVQLQVFWAAPPPHRCHHPAHVCA